jgi:hypothetical protein
VGTLGPGEIIENAIGVALNPQFSPFFFLQLDSPAFIQFTGDL